MERFAGNLIVNSVVFDVEVVQDAWAGSVALNQGRVMTSKGSAKVGALKMMLSVVDLAAWLQVG